MKIPVTCYQPIGIMTLSHALFWLPTRPVILQEFLCLIAVQRFSQCNLQSCDVDVTKEPIILSIHCDRVLE